MKKRFIKESILVCLILSFPFYHVKAQQFENRLPEWALGGFLRPDGVNPIISTDTQSKFFCPMVGKSVYWEARDTFNPAAVVKGNKIVVLYRAEDASGEGIGSRISRLGYAVSLDGLNFRRKQRPVFFPAKDDQEVYEWPGGCEDPRLAVTEGGLYVMLYTQWNRKCPRLAVATSKDLKTWKKYGPVFGKACDGRFHDLKCKSGAILTKVVNGQQVITRINGKYWMYWGEHRVYAATSEDLIEWTPLLDDKGELKTLFAPRQGYFDSALTECGPPAVITEKGILLLYNGKNQKHDKGGDSRFTEGVYAAGQALFDINHPDKLLFRLDVPFFRPMEKFECSGQYKDGTVFVEGLVFFKNKWFLYYGCADSCVGVAVYNPAMSGPGDPVPAK